MAIRLYAANSQVQLDLSSGRQWLSPPSGYALGHDEFGEYFPACTFWLVPLLSKAEAEHSAVGTIARGHPYWTDGKRAFPGWLAISDRGWQRVDSVKRILYFFPGYGWCEHPFGRAVSLYQTNSPHRAWRIGLGSGCWADENGFRIP